MNALFMLAANREDHDVQVPVCTPPPPARSARGSAEAGFGGAGHLTAVTNFNSTNLYTGFDALGRILSHTQTAGRVARLPTRLGVEIFYAFDI